MSLPIYLMIFYLTVASITSKPASSVPHCPPPCACSSRYFPSLDLELQTVDCSGKRLTAAILRNIPELTQALILSRTHLASVPTLDLPNLLHLDLSHNRLRHIPAVNAPLLRSLYMEHNKLTGLEDDSVKMYPHLTELKLHGNRISSITDNALRESYQLELLDLSHNQLTYIHPSWWRSLYSLYDLRLGSNHLTFIQSSALRGLSGLLSLDLSQNQISVLSVSAFKGLRQLESINLSANQLSTVPRLTLSGPSAKLRSLDLGANPIRSLQSNDFANYPELKDIRLNAMPKLRFVTRGAFTNLTNLLMLEMHDNSFLSYVDPRSFINTRSLTHLVLHNNNLTHMYPQISYSLPHLEEISFYGNPLSCDCGSVWLHKQLNNSASVKFTEAEHLTCAFPVEQRYKLFKALDVAELNETCSPMVLSLHETETIAKLGDDITLECRNLVRPDEPISWLLPNGRNSSKTGTYYGLAAVGHSLKLSHVGPTTGGTYTCVGSIKDGVSKASTKLTVEPLDVQLGVVEVASTTAHLVVRGKDRLRHAYHLTLSPLTSGAHRNPVPSIPTFTSVTPEFHLNSILPQTSYEVCLTVTDAAGDSVRLSCRRFTTGRPRPMTRSLDLAQANRLTILTLLALLTLLVIALALVTLLKSRLNLDKNRDIFKEQDKDSCRELLIV